MTVKRFFCCTDCGTVIVEDPDTLYESPKDCPACLSPGFHDTPEPFEKVEVTDV